MCVCARVAPFCTTHKAAPALVVPASRFASPLEVQTLFQHAGLVDIFNGKAEPGNADPAALLLQQLGGWQFADSPYPGAGSLTTQRRTQSRQGRTQVKYVAAVDGGVGVGTRDACVCPF